MYLYQLFKTTVSIAVILDRMKEYCIRLNNEIVEISSVQLTFEKIILVHFSYSLKKYITYSKERYSKPQVSVQLSIYLTYFCKLRFSYLFFVFKFFFGSISSNLSIFEFANFKTQEKYQIIQCTCLSFNIIIKTKDCMFFADVTVMRREKCYLFPFLTMPYSRITNAMCIST